jgi:hypothetical protein
MNLQAGIIGRHGSADLIDGMGEEVFPDGSVGVFTVLCFW